MNVNKRFFFRRIHMALLSCFSVNIAADERLNADDEKNTELREVIVPLEAISSQSAQGMLVESINFK